MDPASAYPALCRADCEELVLTRNHVDPTSRGVIVRSIRLTFQDAQKAYAIAPTHVIVNWMLLASFLPNPLLSLRKDSLDGRGHSQSTSHKVSSYFRYLAPLLEIIVAVADTSLMSK